jgi:hypothetical protein
VIVNSIPEQKEFVWDHFESKPFFRTNSRKYIMAYMIKYIEGELIFEGNSLVGAYLSGVDLNGVDLSGVNLSGAILKCVDLSANDEPLDKFRTDYDEQRYILGRAHKEKIESLEKIHNEELEDLETYYERMVDDYNKIEDLEVQPNKTNDGMSILTIIIMFVAVMLVSVMLVAVIIAKN